MHQGWTMASRLAAAALLLASAAGHAHTTPQWTRSLIQAERRDDYSILRHSWSVTADGGSVIASNSSLWRFRADGSQRFINTLPALATFSGGTGSALMLARDEALDATYVAATASGSCLVLRVDATGTQQWAVEAAGSTAGACTALTVAADGSLILARERALARIARDGQVLWHRGDLQTRPVGIGALLLIDGYSRIVTPRYEGSQAQLARYGLDGAPLGDIALPTSAQPATIHGLDPLPNGDIAVTGREDLTGVLYLLTPVHTLRLLQRSADALPYTRSVNDGATIYVQAGDSLPPGAEQVRAIDALSGALRWQLPAKEVVAARASGVTIVQRPIQPAPAPMQLVALDTYGNGQWSQPLPLGSDDLIHGDTGLNGDGALLALPLQSSAACGKTLTALVLGPGGSIQGRHSACTREIFYPLRGLDARSGAGALVQTSTGIEALSESGFLRWMQYDCRYCTAAEYTRLPHATALLADGAAWLIYRSIDGTTYSAEYRDGSGSPVTGFPLTPGWEVRGALHVDGNVVRAVMRSGSALRVVTLSTSQGAQYSGQILVDGPGSVAGATAQLLPDGDFAVQFQRYTCSFPPCWPRDTTLLRLSPQGQERWRASGLTTYSQGGVYWNDDGSALLVNRFPAPNVQFVSSQGIAAAAQPLDFAAEQMIGPSQGYWLARDTNGVLHRGDAQGVFTMATVAHTVVRLLGAGSQGFLVDAFALNADAALLEPQQLATLATFDAAGLVSPGSTEASGRWRLLDDGSVYGETFEPLPPANSPSPWRVRLSRFAVPGSAAGDLVFADAFE